MDYPEEACVPTLIQVFSGCRRESGLVFGCSLLAGTLVFSGCVPRQSESILKPSGYIVLGPGASAFGLVQGDTVPEVSPLGVPSVVTRDAGKQALVYGYDPTCNRYFSERGPYVVLLLADCTTGGVVDDGEGMAVYSHLGEPLGDPTPVVQDEYCALVPARRSP